MPPTDDDVVRGSRASLLPEPRGRLGDTRDSMEARALRQQLDRVRTLQQRNDVLSGDKLLAARHEGSKPHSVRNYYKWLRAVAEGEAPAPSSAPPAPQTRPRSRSLQLDAADVSMFTRATPDTDRCADRCPSPTVDSSCRKNRTAPKLTTYVSSEDESARNTPPQCVSPQQHRQHTLKKPNLKKDSGKSLSSTKNFTHTLKSKLMPSNSAKSVRSETDRKVKADRGVCGTVTKPKPGPSGSHRVLQPIQRQRSKSLDVDGAKFVAQARDLLSPSVTPVLPDISTDDSDSTDSRSTSSPENFSPAQEIKLPVSILKKASVSKNGFKKTKSRYAVHVSFSDMTATIPFRYTRSRRASITEENSTRNVREEKRARCVSPPPPTEVAASTYDEEKSPWLAPGVFLGIRRNSLPPLSVTLSEIQAAGSDGEDGDLFKPVRDRHVDVRITELGPESHETSPSAGAAGLAYVVKTDSSDSGDDDSEASATMATHARSRPVAAPRSCFNVPRRSQTEDSDSGDEITCQVVHSFTPRPKLRNRVLPSASSAFQCASGSL